MIKYESKRIRRNKKELDKEHNNLVEYYNDCYSKSEILNKNTKNLKFTIASVIAALTWIPLCFIGLPLLNGLSSLTIRTTLYMPLVTAISGTLGYIGQKIITFSSRRKMKKFTKANKNREIVTEAAHYELEMKKADHKLAVIKAIYDKIESKEKILQEITRDGKYTITENSLSEEELNKNYELIMQKYNDKMKQLDIMVSQEFLRNKFRNYRRKTTGIYNAIMDGLMLGLIISFPTGLGVMLDLSLSGKETVASMSELFKILGSCFIPSLAISPITVLCLSGRNNDYLYAYNYLNKTLGENALEQKPNRKSEENLKANIENLTNELVELGYSLQETKHTLKQLSLQNCSKDNSKTLENSQEKTWEDMLISEEEIKVYMQSSPAPFSFEDNLGVEQEDSLEKKNVRKLVRKSNTHKR